MKCRIGYGFEKPKSVHLCGEPSLNHHTCADKSILAMKTKFSGSACMKKEHDYISRDYLTRYIKRSCSSF